MTLKTYYSDLRAKAGALLSRYPTDTLLVVSVANPLKNITGGSTCEVTTGNAARLIMDGTHREATAEESRAYQEAQEFKRPPSGDLLATARRQFGLLTRKKGDA